VTPILIRAEPRPFPTVGLSSRSTAVVMIDMQRDFLDDDGYLAAAGYDLGGVRAAVDPARRLLEAARAANLAVIHTRQGYWPDLRELPAHKRARVADGSSSIGTQGPLGRFLIRGEPGHEIVPELEPLPGEPVVDKSGCGAFWGTDLASILQVLAVDSLILAGVTTDVCVHSTLREACDRGYECLLVRDACGSGDAEAHRAALHMVTVEDGVFGVLADVEDVCDGLGRIGQPSRRATG
jgi:nicotinamidase-related amidase